MDAAAGEAGDSRLDRLGAQGLVLRAAVVAFGYLVVEVLAGGFVNSLTRPPAASRGLLWPAISALTVAVSIAPVASRLNAGWHRQAVVWGTLIFLNSASVLVEGLVFAPGEVPRPAALLSQQLLTAACGGLLLAWAFARPSPTPAPAPQRRAALSWASRFLLAAASYLVFYLVFGALNYRLFTAPYYAAQGGGLVVPPLPPVLVAEAIRAPMIVFSLLPLLLSIRGSRTKLALLCGYLLFTVGGVAPLVLQAGVLPAFLLVASGWEILFQNMGTGAVIALLLGSKERDHRPSLSAGAPPSPRKPQYRTQ